MKRTIFDEEHDLFRDSFRRFVQDEVVPHYDDWEKAGIVDRDLFAKAGANGFLGMAVPEQHSGGGVDDFRYNVVLNEELCRADAASAGLGLTLHTDICMPYFLEYCNDEQAARWLPGIASGDLITAIAMTEPETGSDVAGIRTTAVREGDHYVVNGAKTFITNGINSDLVITAVKTDPDAGHRGISLLVVERGMEGFERGRNLEKLGLHAQDTAELFFNDVRVPAANLLGEEGKGFYYLMHNLAQERLSIAVSAVAQAWRSFEHTLNYVKQRQAFGQPIGKFQHLRFGMAELKTKLDIARTFVDRCVEAHVAGELTAEDAAEAKWWTTDLQQEVADVGLQFHGGYGYMLEYPISRAFVDARVQRIYAGTNEIMKEIVGRSLGL